MPVVVTGATGLIGRALARHLLAAGHAVTAVSRDPGRAALLLPARCAVAACGPAGDLDADLLRGAGAVVHLAGAGVADRRWTPAWKGAIRDSRVGTTQALVRALAALPAAQRPATLVCASAIGVYGDRGDEPLDELSAAGTGFLADVCREWEAAAAAAADLGVRTVLVRIGIVLAREGGALGRLLPLFRLGLGARLGSGRQWMSWIHLDDVVAILGRAVADARLRGVVNAVAPEPVRHAAFADALARALGRRQITPPVPAPLLRVVLGEQAALVLASQRVRPAALERLGHGFRFPALDAALADLCRDLTREVVFEQALPLPPEAVFPFFADAYNLERITPPFLRFRVLGLSTPEIMAGTLIDYRLRLHGVPLRWRSRIAAWEPGRRFVDEQVRGPFALWHHTHTFTPAGAGTLMEDRVRYRLPLGALGDLIAGGFVARDVEAIFRYRRETIARLFPSPLAEAAPAAAAEPQGADRLA